MFASELDESFRDPTRSIEQASDFWKHITLDGRIPTTFVDVLDTTRTKKIGEKDIGQHFQKFGNLLSQNSFVQAPKEKYKNFIFPRSNLDILKDHQGKEKLFPIARATTGTTSHSHSHSRSHTHSHLLQSISRFRGGL